MNTPEEYLSDENNWIPSGLLIGMFEKARAITGNPNVAFDIGFDSILNREFSYWQKIFFKIFSSPLGAPAADEPAATASSTAPRSSSSSTTPRGAP